MKSLGLIKKALVGSIATLCIASIAYGEELKVCETKQDKMSGCIEMIEGEESYQTLPIKTERYMALLKIPCYIVRVHGWESQRCLMSMVKKRVKHSFL